MRKNFKIPQGEGEHLFVLSDRVTIKTTSLQSSGQLAVVEVTCPPGGGPPMHRHPSAETFYVLSGELSVSIQDKEQQETVTATTGDTVNIASMQWHSYTNTSSEPVKFLAMLTPGGMEDFFRELGVPLSEGSASVTPPGRPSAEQKDRMMQIINKYVEIQVPA